ncbi:MAG: hypothetical protein ACK5OS_02085 [Chryseotalea sp.]
MSTNKRNKIEDFFLSYQFAGFLWSIVMICLLALIISTCASCSNGIYCHTYSGARYNAGQKGYPAKYNPIQSKPRKSHRL